ncbi:MAG: SurA N-terminal domain-containing protein [Candidatus Omnitrophica bacterium]|nr:SurA N-terminal domain-containing protein [Candidatus Omnitrophota bacterium]
MLKFLRKNTKSIVWAVVIAFVAWGGYAVSLQFDQSTRAPGRIFGKEVSFREYLLANRAVQIFQPRPEEGKEPPTADEIEAQTWQFLILSHEASQRKIQVLDDETRDEIARLLSDKEGNMPFTHDQYAQWVRNTLREEPPEFESQVREQIRIRKLIEEVRKELGPSEEDLKKWMLELATRAKIQVHRPRS